MAAMARRNPCTAGNKDHLYVVPATNLVLRQSQVSLPTIGDLHDYHIFRLRLSFFVVFLRIQHGRALVCWHEG